MRLLLLAAGMALTLPVTLATLQGGGGGSTLGGSGLGNCEIEMRPKGNREAQLYWEDPQDSKYGTSFELWVPEDVKLKGGDGNAKDEIDLGLGKNTFVFTRDASTTPAYVDLVITSASGTTKTYPKIDFRGTFDPLAGIVEPTMTEVRSNDLNPRKRRQRITVTNYGLTYSFTITDAK